MQPMPVLPPLPRKRRPKIAKPAPLAFGPWGGLTNGRWAQADAGTLRESTCVVGRCGGCGEVTPAGELKWRDGAFGRPGRWLCGECR